MMGPVSLSARQPKISQLPTHGDVAGVLSMAGYPVAQIPTSGGPCDLLPLLDLSGVVTRVLIPGNSLLPFPVM